MFEPFKYAYEKKIKVQNNLLLNATKFSDYIQLLFAYLHKIKNSLKPQHS